MSVCKLAVAMEMSPGVTLLSLNPHTFLQHQHFVYSFHKWPLYHLMF